MFMMPVATLLFFLIAQTCCTASDPSLLRNVTSGLVQGTWQYIHNPGTGGYEGRVAVWKSIPYGQAPAANLRWRPPLPALRWSGILDATKYRAPCVQSDGSGSEDCLHLHITAPADAPDCSVSLLPVLVYIHGGGLMDGCGSFEDMGAFTLHANVVVVTINYRLNVFGWLALKSLQSADGSVGNYGMLDQQLALQWTRSNIMAFGGDPNRVTVAGQSSGGTSIFALYCSPLSVGLFDRAVSFSGSINISMDPGRAFLQNKVIPDLLNCSGVAELECLHRASVQQLVQAQQLSKWGQTPGIFGLDHTSPGGLSPSARWFGASSVCSSVGPLLFF
jgi:para-nitrobenzyl esterase